MIEDAPIVKETRHVRCAISQQFNHDIDRYIDYLRTQGTRSSSITRDKQQRVQPHQLPRETVSS